MPPWPFRASPSNHSAKVKQWADQVAVAPDGDQYHKQQKASHATTATSSTAGADSLPAPVQADRCPSITRKSKKLRFNTLQTLWEDFKERIGTGTAPSSSTFGEDTPVDRSTTTIHAKRVAPHDEYDDEELDEVVVDRVWTDEYHSTISHLSDNEESSPERSGHYSSSAAHEDTTSKTPGSKLMHVRDIAIAVFMAVFSSRFVDDKKEHHYQQEEWFIKKSLALVTSLWWIVNWVLACIFVKVTDPALGPGDYAYYYGVAPLLSIPVVFLVMFDWPRDRQYIYQIYLTLSIWCWPFYHVIYINVCGFYRGGDCHGRDFQAIFYYTTALQTIAFFGLKLNRLPAAFGALAYMLLASITIIPDRPQWARSMINFFIYHAFLIYVHFTREQNERRLYTMRDQLKMQYRATQRAQLNERKASDSKRRLTSYVFHEVRVPLNTALLAVQNMAASGTVAKNQEIEFNALSGSLSMMSKVLNDVLDFNRMDMGKFESASRPYQFHQVMRSLFIPLRLATDARGLEFETNLDPNIDIVARALAYEALGETPDAIRAHFKQTPTLDGIVVGDEARLRQIVTNLASNACKFTPPGGKMTIKTKLIRPSFSESDDPLAWIFPPRDADPSVEATGNVEDDAESPTGTSGSKPLSAELLSQHNFHTRGDKDLPEAIVVRIEISDTGVGIRPREMATQKLFSAFNQTEQGIQQGGKGTGLGLALVRQIVKLTGGRLGVKSKVGEGSTFWVELPLGVGRKTFNPSNATSKHETSSRPSNTSIHTDPRNNSMGLFETKNSEAPASASDANISMSLQVKPSESLQQDSPDPFADSKGHKPPSRPGSSSKTLRRKHPLQETIIMQDIRAAIPCPPQELPPQKPVPDSGTAPVNHCEDNPRPGRPTHVILPGPPAFGHHTSAFDDPHSSGPTTDDSPTAGMSALTAYDTVYAQHGSASSSSPAVNVVQGLNALVVDDDPLTRMLMTRILTRLGCQVTTAENGEAAIDLILGSKGWAGLTPNSSDSHSKYSGPILEQPKRLPEDLGQVPEEMKYAVIFLDNQMPIMSGLKTVERLRQLGRKDFVVGVTGNALLSDQREYLEAGADKVLTKPVLERSLREALVAAEEKIKSRLVGGQLDEGGDEDPLKPPNRLSSLNTSSTSSLPLESLARRQPNNND